MTRYERQLMFMSAGGWFMIGQQTFHLLIMKEGCRENHFPDSSIDFHSPASSCAATSAGTTSAEAAETTAGISSSH